MINLSISVVIPTLNNRQKFMYEAIKSVENQTYKPKEVIIINNGLNEVELPKSCLNLTQHKIIYKAGVAQARNFGASVAKGSYLAFLDDDDLWTSNYLENMKKVIDKDHPDCLIATLDQLVNGKIIPLKNADGLINQNVILYKNPGITGSSVVTKKESFFIVGGYNPKLPPSEDKSYVLELIKKEFKVVSVPESKAILRQHKNVGRLTDHKHMAEGVFQFYHNYRNVMDTSQKLYNLYKFNKFCWMDQRSLLSGVKCLIYLIFLIPGKLYHKLKNQ